jgi:hypothetical protein
VFSVEEELDGITGRLSSTVPPAGSRNNGADNFEEGAGCRDNGQHVSANLQGLRQAILGIELSQLLFDD